MGQRYTLCHLRSRAFKISSDKYCSHLINNNYHLRQNTKHSVSVVPLRAERYRILIDLNSSLCATFSSCQINLWQLSSQEKNHMLGQIQDLSLTYHHPFYQGQFSMACRTVSYMTFCVTIPFHGPYLGFQSNAVFGNLSHNTLGIYRKGFSTHIQILGNIQYTI